MFLKVLLTSTALFAVYANVFSLWAPIVIRGVFWGFIAMVVFLQPQKGPKKRWSYYLDMMLAILAALSTTLLVLRWEVFASGIHGPTTLELAAAIVMVLLLCVITMNWDFFANSLRALLNLSMLDSSRAASTSSKKQNGLGLILNIA